MSHWGERGVWVDQDVMEEQKRENIKISMSDFFQFTEKMCPQS